MAGRLEDYGLIGDLHTAALVGRDGSVDWLCLPHFDSPASFAALVGGESAGRWLVAPAEGGPAVRRSYRGDTLILESEWDAAGGTVRVIDCMPPRGVAADVVRVVEGLSGAVPMCMRLRLRFDYGSVTPWVRRVGEDMMAVAGPDAVRLRTEVATEIRDGVVTADFIVRAGQRVAFVLTYQPSHLDDPARVSAHEAVADTERFWTDWIGRCTYDGPYADAVRRSLVLLKALTYAPTGGMVAAATTSLPELVGGARNWDYRYCWLRDATFTLRALLGTGYVAEAKAWRDWLLRAIAGDPADLQIMYTMDGSRRVPEYTVDWLCGYENSTPVRVGNAATSQFQLDVWGEVLNVLHLGRVAGITPTDAAWDLQRAMLDFLEGHWREPDNGLWEMRGPRRQFVHSKVLAWAGFDRAITAAHTRGLDGPVKRWQAARDEIHREVCERGFDADRNTFTQSYGSTGLDAALLLIHRVGFLPATDPRFVGTVDAIIRDLSVDGLLLRYDPQHDGGDGLAGGENPFVACSFWLVDALHAIGRTQRARELFERLLALRNDLGLLSEEYDPVAGRQLGNTPQAFSLVGLVNSARRQAGADVGP